MRIIFLVVGRMKSGPERELVDEYIKRAGPIARSLGFRRIEEVEVASGGGLDAEAERILAKLPAGAKCIRLDEFEHIDPVISPPILQNGATRVSLTWCSLLVERKAMATQ